MCEQALKESLWECLHEIGKHPAHVVDEAFATALSHIYLQGKPSSSSNISQENLHATLTQTDDEDGRLGI